MAISNAGSPGQLLFPYTQPAAVHTQLVRDYFVNAGLPADQIQSVHANTAFKTSAPVDQLTLEPANRQFVSYSSVIARVVSGYFVANSVAWARFNNAGEVVAEHVFWPELPASVVDDARALSATLHDPAAKKAFVAKLPPNLPQGSVGIVHSSFAAAGIGKAFVAAAVYDVVIRSSGSASTRHFKKDGTEFRLPEET